MSKSGSLRYLTPHVTPRHVTSRDTQFILVHNNKTLVATSLPIMGEFCTCFYIPLVSVKFWFYYMRNVSTIFFIQRHGKICAPPKCKKNTCFYMPWVAEEINSSYKIVYLFLHTVGGWKFLVVLTWEMSPFFVLTKAWKNSAPPTNSDL